MGTCGACGGYARAQKNPLKEARGKRCPRFGEVHWECCASLDCSRFDRGGNLRCDYERWRGGRGASRKPAAPEEAATGTERRLPEIEPPALPRRPPAWPSGP